MFKLQFAGKRSFVKKIMIRHFTEVYGFDSDLNNKESKQQ